MHCLLTLLVSLEVYYVYSEHIFSAGPPNPENLPEDGKLKSEMMSKDNKRYYLDLKENQRGRFLRVRPNKKNMCV